MVLAITSPFIKRCFLSPRFYHNASRYDGYWTLLLQQPKIDQIDTATFPARPVDDSAALDTTNNDLEVASSAPLIENASTSTEISNDGSDLSTGSRFVWLHNEKIPLPEKPPPPENCCMSGCAYCVYDIYQEDMEAYKHNINELRQRFATANVDLPEVLQTKKKASAPQTGNSTDDDDDDDDDGMDPTMKAFLEMEKKLNAKS